jgi:hypothetical protein
MEEMSIPPSDVGFRGPPYSRRSSMSDAEFDVATDGIVSSTSDLVNRKKIRDYTPTGFLFADGEVSINALVAEDDEADADIDDLFRGFGESLAPSCSQIEAVFVAAESTSGEGNESITITGCTPDRRFNAVELVIQRNARQVM